MGLGLGLRLGGRAEVGDRVEVKARVTGAMTW